MKRTCKFVALTIMLAAVLLSMTACGKTRIDIADGMTVEFSGVDGKGYASIAYPDSDETPPYVDKLLKTKKLDATDWYAWMMLEDAISCEVEPSSGLSNGDKVTVTIDVDEAILENMGVSAKDKKITFKVKGLTEVTVIDAFKDLEVKFTGISPDVDAEFPWEMEVDGATVYYSCDDKYDCKEGDMITITAKIGGSNADYYALKETEKAFLVANVDKYITQAAELRPETLDLMKKESEKIVAEKVQSWGGKYTYKGFEYVGYEFFGLQDLDDNYNKDLNYVYMYYKISANDGENDFDTYYFVRYRDVLQYADGTQEVDVTDYKHPTFWRYGELKEYTTLEARTEEQAKKYPGYVIEKFF